MEEHSIVRQNFLHDSSIQPWWWQWKKSFLTEHLETLSYLESQAAAAHYVRWSRFFTPLTLCLIWFTQENLPCRNWKNQGHLVFENMYSYGICSQRVESIFTGCQTWQTSSRKESQTSSSSPLLWLWTKCSCRAVSLTSSPQIIQTEVETQLTHVTSRNILLLRHCPLDSLNYLSHLFAIIFHCHRQYWLQSLQILPVINLTSAEN